MWLALAHSCFLSQFIIATDQQLPSMEKHLLQKEEEYYKVNDELELKTQQLMKEVENVMCLKPQLQKRAALPPETKSQYPSATQNSCFLNSSEFSIPLSVKTKTPEGFSGEGLKERTAELLEENYGKKLDKNNHVKSSFGRGGDQSPERELPHIEGISRKVDQLISGLQISAFSDKDLDDEGLYHDLTMDKKIFVLRNKIKVLQNEMQTLQTDYKKKNEEWKKLQGELKISEEKCTKLQQKTVALTKALKKQEQHNADMSARLSQKETENKAINKELQVMSKELKGAMKTVATTQMQLNHTLEEREKLHATVQLYKGEDRDFRECSRKRMEELAQTVHNTEKGKGELLHICKVQMQLIDNLKKQKVHLQASRMVQFTEEEFLKLLDWSPSSFTALP